MAFSCTIGRVYCASKLLFKSMISFVSFSFFIWISSGIFAGLTRLLSSKNAADLNVLLANELSLSESILKSCTTALTSFVQHLKSKLDAQNEFSDIVIVSKLLNWIKHQNDDTWICMSLRNRFSWHDEIHSSITSDTTMTTSIGVRARGAGESCSLTRFGVPSAFRAKYSEFSGTNIRLYFIFHVF